MSDIPDHRTELKMPAQAKRSNDEARRVSGGR